ncbi:MAG: Gar1/Naf1 family protein [Candidatus Thorarchaeota archaeon]|nr:Gar1/Naf1 family protein [Candidatus Thorarchaeota archaeon]
MRRLGKVLQVTKRGSVIVQTDKSPPIGAKVVDKQAQPIGIIQDVFGPVNNPYVSIRSKNHEKSLKLINQIVYLYKK